MAAVVLEKSIGLGSVMKSFISRRHHSNHLVTWSNLLTLCLLAAIFACNTSIYAASPWETLIPFKKVDADPNGNYAITQSSAPG